MMNELGWELLQPTELFTISIILELYLILSENLPHQLICAPKSFGAQILGTAYTQAIMGGSSNVSNNTNPTYVEEQRKIIQNLKFLGQSCVAVLLLQVGLALLDISLDPPILGWVCDIPRIYVCTFQLDFDFLCCSLHVYLHVHREVAGFMFHVSYRYAALTLTVNLLIINNELGSYSYHNIF